MELDATGAEVVEPGYQVAQATAQRVELPYDQCVAVFQFLQAAEQGRAPRRGSRQAFILENDFTSGLLQCRELQGGVLVISRDDCLIG